MGHVPKYQKEIAISKEKRLASKSKAEENQDIWSRCEKKKKKKQRYAKPNRVRHDGEVGVEDVKGCEKRVSNVIMRYVM